MSTLSVLIIYNVLLPLVLIVGFPKYLIKAIQRGNVKQNFLQRLGRYTPDLRKRLEGLQPIWIHAVSVGEVIVAQKIIAAIRAVAPHQPLLLSTTTPTGYALATEKPFPGLEVIYNPVDLPWIVRKVVNLIRPEALVLVEAEVWPNLVHTIRRSGSPVLLVNARLSERSERRFRQFKDLTGPVFRMLDQIFVQFESDVERWKGLGVEESRVQCLGSVKFDDGAMTRPDVQIEELRQVLRSLGVKDDRRIFLAGSTHAGEEALVAAVYLRLRDHHPGLFYVAVPRHAERAHKAAADLQKMGLHPVLKASLNGDTAPPLIDPRTCLIVNTTGELRAWYYLADLVVVGKSFLARGGQNPVEAVLAEKPTMFGPYMHNFQAIVGDLVRHEGAVQVAHAEELFEKSDQLLGDRAGSRAMTDRGRQAMECHEGAARRTAAGILEAIR